MTHFCLVRHGQTDWNLEGRYQGQTDIPLNEAGRIEARSLAETLQGMRFGAVYSSDLVRARETADIIAAQVVLPVQIDVRLREINQGVWEGLQVDFIRSHYAGLWQQRDVDPASMRAPGGETVNEVAQRMYAALDEIAAVHPDGSVLLVSHGLSLATILCKLRGIPLGKAYEVIPPNAEPIWVEWVGSSQG
jgi:broad specificity phosphatase PhoE